MELYARRYHTEPGAAGPLLPVPVPHRETPMRNLLTYFFEGIEGGDRQRFCTRLGLDVVTLLAACQVQLRRRWNA